MTLDRLWGKLLQPCNNIVLFVITRSLACYAGNLLMAMVIKLCGFSIRDVGNEGLTPLLLITSLIAAPFLENVLLVATAAFAAKFCTPFFASFFSALLLAGLHSSASWAWGIVVFWSFLTMAGIYLQWRTFGRAKAYAVTVGIHCLVNVPAMVAMAMPLI